MASWLPSNGSASTLPGSLSRTSHHHSLAPIVPPPLLPQHGPLQTGNSESYHRPGPEGPHLTSEEAEDRRAGLGSGSSLLMHVPTSQ